MLQQLTVRSMGEAVRIAQQLGSWRESVCTPDKAVWVYRSGQPFAVINVQTPLDDRRANAAMALRCRR